MTLITTVMTAVCWAQAPVVGKKAADKYFPATKGEQTTVEQVKSSPSYEQTEEDSAPSRTTRGSDEEMMMLGLGSFLNSETYNWNGAEKREGVGRVNYGFTYLLEEESKYDIGLRVEFTEYKVGDERALKLSALPILTFPRFSSQFPIYFGIGAGLGAFFIQVPEESSLSFDYQLIGGARFMEIVPNFGVYIELALKNHLLLTTNGQFNGVALNAGGVFTF